ncbi:hypothetical protein SAMN02745166_02504 [Prosthecobacter debontii]|uniref:KTSC domain-containing protein n=1 Tax=Prosthecobacter debontii TaxID=48467 RepID=A0A1T4Y5M9_9BACT|nr:hypothetical protein [Prosthecobacter debontii]SKA96953.1 hypothetical protein SAMN02745166_02504 [Prosthecobacter debontii]
MKASTCTSFALILLMAASLQAAPLEEITTLTGKTYRQCEIVKVYPDGVSFTHADGAAKVLFTDLSQEWRERLGYDPAKAAAYELEQAERREKQAEARRELDRQQTEAMLLAQQIELARLRGIEAQARSQQLAVAKAPLPNPPLVPVLPELGATFDSSDYRGVGYRDSNIENAYGYGGYPYGAYGAYPIYRGCPPYHLGGSIRARLGRVTFTIGR